MEDAIELSQVGSWYGLVVLLYLKENKTSDATATMATATRSLPLVLHA